MGGRLRPMLLLAQAAGAGAALDHGAVERWTAWLAAAAHSPVSHAVLFAWAFAESSFFPVPPDAGLIALCLATADDLAACLVFAGVCAVGSTAGGALGYGLGVWVGRPVLRRLASETTVGAAERLLQRYDMWAVAAAGFTPIPYKVFTIASGMLRVKFWRFLVASAVSRGARFFLVAVLVRLAGEEVKAVFERHFWWATLVLLALVAAGFCALKALAARWRGGPELP